MRFRQGDRVRIRNLRSEYTGCRGTIADPDPDPDSGRGMDPERDEDPGVTALGRLVAIDGENGIARPFLIADLEPLRALRVAPPSEVERMQAGQGADVASGTGTREGRD